MPAERYFIDELLQSHEIKILRGTEFHHLVHVMRTRKGEQVELVNGQGLLARTIVKEIRKDQALLLIEQIEQEPPPSIQVILAQAIPKLNRLDFILEKGTELGVHAFWLFPGQQSVKKDFQGKQLERLKAITIAAMKQCGRLYLPDLQFKPPLANWQPLQGTLFFGDVDPAAPLLGETWRQACLNSPIIFFTGPESGFTLEEIKWLKQMGAQGTKLHDLILRTDTASIAALSVIQHLICLSLTELKQ
jgi:16S rRNA (uracil1498-N3)-methyltransferase